MARSFPSKRRPAIAAVHAPVVAFAGGGTRRCRNGRPRSLRNAPRFVVPAAPNPYSNAHDKPWQTAGLSGTQRTHGTFSERDSSDLLTARFRVRIPGPEPIVNSKLTPSPTRALARTSFVHPFPPRLACLLFSACWREQGGFRLSLDGKSCRTHVAQLHGGAVRVAQTLAAPWSLWK